MTYINTSTSEGAVTMRGVLEQAMSKRLASASNVIDTVRNQIVEDCIVKGSALQFQASTTATVSAGMPTFVQMVLPNGTERNLHRNAVRQISDKTGLPIKYADQLSSISDAWGSELLAHNFNELLHNANGTKYLVRSVGPDARAFLSDRYRRIDSRPLIDAFAEESQRFGLQPYEGYALDTTIRIRGIIPAIFEPFPGEYLAFGLQWKNSDFGVGGHEIGFFILRPQCLNGAVGESFLRQVHLGAKLSEDIVFSEETYKLDTRTNVSALRDIIRQALGQGNIDQQVSAIRYAHEKNITPIEAKEFLAKNLLKGDVEEVTEAFVSPDIEMMPSGQNQWRLSNALSWVGNLKAERGETEKALELQNLAGTLIPKIKLLSA